MGPHDRFEISRSFVPVDDPYLDAFEMGVEPDAVSVQGECCFFAHLFVFCFFSLLLIFFFRFTVRNACGVVWWECEGDVTLVEFAE